MQNTLKEVQWIGSSKKDLKSFPREVRHDIGYSLHLAQEGKMPDQAKPLKGFGGAGVLEIIEDFDGDTYRAVYTVKFPEFVFILHCFQKKSTKGIATPKHEMDVVRRRLKFVEEVYPKLKQLEVPKNGI